MPKFYQNQCWRCDCGRASSFFCESCGALVPVEEGLDYFVLFGVDRTPLLNDEFVKAKYYELSRRIHPDLYQGAGQEEKQASVKNTTMLNQAYQTFTDPVRLGQYWLELHGEELGKDNSEIPQELAGFVFEMHEKLAEFREATAREKTQLSENETGLDELRAMLKKRKGRFMEQLAANFTLWDSEARDGKHSESLLRNLKETLSGLAYLQTLDTELEKGSSESWNI